MSDSNSSKPSLSYKDAGVDIDAGNQLVQRLKGIAKKTKRPGVLSGLGGFGALFELPRHYDQPVLVSGTDGVGTKLKLAMDMGKHDTIGIDLVAMCVNDLVVTGADPLFFLDYYATGALNVSMAEEVVTGIGIGCEQAGCALTGGETAEMPGVYQGNDYDLAGFCVGVVEKKAIITGERISAGNVLIGLASSGAHSNGFSLIRKILSVNEVSLSQQLGERSVGSALLEPTRIYVKAIQKLLADNIPINGIAHITGGGLPENLPRILQPHTKAVVDTASWDWPPLFQFLKDQGNVSTEEMYRTFNCGVGMVVCVPADVADNALDILRHQGETAWVLGSVAPSGQSTPSVEFVKR